MFTGLDTIISLLRSIRDNIGTGGGGSGDGISENKVNQLIDKAIAQLKTRDIAKLENSLHEIYYELYNDNNDEEGLGDIIKIKQAIEELQLFKYPNATIVGSPSINHGSVSGFTKENYLHFPTAFDFNNEVFSIELDFTTGSDVGVHQVLIGSLGSIELFINNGQLGIKISTDGTGWQDAKWSGTDLVNPNTHYQLKVSWNKLQYKVDYKVYGSGEYINAINFALAQQPFAQTWNIGISNVDTQTGNPFKGTVNLNNWYISSRGEIIWQGMDDAGLATRLATDLSNIDPEGEERVKEIVKTEVSELSKKVGGLETAVGGKYEKPSDGIPATDLSTDLQTFISRADEIYNDYINAQNLM